MAGHTGRRCLIIVVMVLAGLLVVARAAAPTLVQRYLNDALADLGDYRGHVGDVDLELLQGGYTLHDVIIEKVDSRISEPLVELPAVRASVQWQALLAGELVSDVMLLRPAVHFVQREDEQQYGEGTDWRERLRSLFPIRVNRILVRDGQAHFRQPDSTPAVDVFLSDVDIVVSNLTNIRESAEPVFTGIRASATAMGHAPVVLEGRLDVLREQPEFDLNFDLRELDLPRLNPLLRAYAGVTAEGGTFSLSGELAGAEGAYDGYVKPLLDHAKFVSLRDFRQRPLGALWDTTVAALAELVENQPRDRIGTRVPLKGTFEPSPDVMAAVGGVFRNMFDAFLQGIEGSVNLHDALERATSAHQATFEEGGAAVAQRATGHRVPRALPPPDPASPAGTCPGCTGSLPASPTAAG